MAADEDIIYALFFLFWHIFLAICKFIILTYAFFILFGYIHLVLWKCGLLSAPRQLRYLGHYASNNNHQRLGSIRADSDLSAEAPPGASALQGTSPRSVFVFVSLLHPQSSEMNYDVEQPPPAYENLPPPSYEEAVAHNSASTATTAPLPELIV